MSAAVYNAILYNASLYSGIPIPDPAEPTISWSTLLTCLYPRLHASTAADLVWWTEADLRQWANEAIQLLAAQVPVFIRRNIDLNTVNGQRAYALPARHLATLHVTYDDQPLQPTDLALIDARDAAADAAVCGVGEVPKRWYEDTFGIHSSIGIYPSPSAAETLAILFSQQPALLTSTASTLPIPVAIGAYIQDYVLAKAWAHDSDFSMPELAAHFESKYQMYISLYQSYWGPV